MVSPTTSQPESHVALAPVANVDLPKPPAKTTTPDHPSCSSSSSSSSSTTAELNGHVSENKDAGEINKKEPEPENLTNEIMDKENDSDKMDDNRKTSENYRNENDTKEDTGTKSEISHNNILTDSNTSQKDNIPSTTSKSDSKLSSPPSPIPSPTFSTTSSFNSASDQSSTTPNPTSPKNFTSAPIPTVNVWAMRKAAMNAKAKKEEKEKEKEKEKEREGKDKEGDGDHRKAGENIRKDGDRNCKENGIVNEFADETKRFTKKNSKKSKPAPILPPLEDQSSWPAPAEVLIKDKAKEASELAEKKNDTGKKEEGSSPKRGKGKWIPIPATITHTTPLPTHHHGYKHRRRSEDTITLSHNRRDRYSQYDDVNGRDGREGRWDKEGKDGRGWDREGRRGRGGEGGESSGRENGRENGREGNNGEGNGNGHGHGTTTGHRRRASVPPSASGQYARRYLHNSDGNGQVSGHANNNMYRGRRTGRGRSYGSRGPPRSASALYSPGYPQTYSVFPNAKMPVVIDVDLLKYYILQQVEYYFSVENLCKDIFLRTNMDLEGYVDVSLLAGFNRVKNLTTDEALVREALLYSHILEVNGDKVRKREGWDFWLLSKQVNGRQTTDINIDIDHQNCATLLNEIK